MNAQWLIAIPLLGIFTFCACINFWLLARSVRHRLRPLESRPPSMLYVAGGLLGWLGVMSLPLGTTFDRFAYSWIPLVLDITVPFTAVMLPYLFARSLLDRFGLVAFDQPGPAAPHAPSDETNRT